MDEGGNGNRRMLVGGRLNTSFALGTTLPFRRCPMCTLKGSWGTKTLDSSYDSMKGITKLCTDHWQITRTKKCGENSRRQLRYRAQ